MTWQAYHVVLRLLSPLHVGAGKVGNLQRARPYVAGRNLWGALTAGLTRRVAKTAPVFDDYKTMGDRIHDELAFTYFYPTTCAQGTVILWPWDEGFRYHFLSTYASTALDYDASSAEEASLHEVECITPHTRDTGKPVYLTGYVFEAGDAPPDWQSALADTQIGGERGYGWGRVTLEKAELATPPKTLFDTGHVAHLDGERVRIELAAGKPLLAHALAAEFKKGQHPLPASSVSGTVEPLVGRETRDNARSGQTLSRARICYAPGAQVAPGRQGAPATSVCIGHYGVWEAADAQA